MSARRDAIQAGAAPAPVGSYALFAIFNDLNVPVPAPAGAFVCGVVRVDVEVAADGTVRSARRLLTPDQPVPDWLVALFGLPPAPPAD